MKSYQPFNAYANGAPQPVALTLGGSVAIGSVQVQNQGELALVVANNAALQNPYGGMIPPKTTAAVLCPDGPKTVYVGKPATAPGYITDAALPGLALVSDTAMAPYRESAPLFRWYGYRALLNQASGVYFDLNQPLGLGFAPVIYPGQKLVLRDLVLSGYPATSSFSVGVTSSVGNIFAELLAGFGVGIFHFGSNAPSWGITPGYEALPLVAITYKLSAAYFGGGPGNAAAAMAVETW